MFRGLVKGDLVTKTTLIDPNSAALQPLFRGSSAQESAGLRRPSPRVWKFASPARRADANSRRTGALSLLVLSLKCVEIVKINLLQYFSASPVTF